MLPVVIAMVGLVRAPPSTIIVGGGPAGLATAIAFARRGWKRITVLDRLEPPALVDDASVWSDTARHYLIGLNGRGQRALKSLGAWDGVVEPYCSTVVGRKDWAPGASEGIERIFTDRPYLTRVIPRERLVSCLLAHAEQKYGDAIEVRHGIEVRDLRWEGLPSEPNEQMPAERAVILCDPCAAREGSSTPTDPIDSLRGEVDEFCTVVDEGGPFELSAALIVGADGARRTVAHAIEEADRAKRWVWPGSRFRVRRYVDTAVRVYKTIPLKLPSSWRTDSALTHARTRPPARRARPLVGTLACGPSLRRRRRASLSGFVRLRRHAPPPPCTSAGVHLRRRALGSHVRGGVACAPQSTTLRAPRR